MAAPLVDFIGEEVRRKSGKIGQVQMTILYWCLGTDRREVKWIPDKQKVPFGSGAACDELTSDLEGMFCIGNLTE